MAPTRRRRMPAAQRREVILVAAEETFARSGYHGASLDDVAHAAGVSKALIYEHFESKRELHGSLLDAHAAEIFRRLEAAAERGETGEERLRNGIDAFLRFVEERREAWRALFRDAADPEVAALISRVQTRATGVIAGLIAADPDGPADLAYGDPDRAMRIEIHAQMLSGAVQSLATWWHDHREIPRALLVDRAMEFCRHGTAPDANPVVPGAAAAGATAPPPPAAGAVPRAAPVGTPAL
jgi:AcrR family transcriptional regulator